jgi:hypothetical protein
LASRLGAACLVDASVEVRGDHLVLGEGTGEATRCLSGDLDFPSVVQLAPGRYEVAAGDEEAEVEMLEAPPRERSFEALGTGSPLGALGLPIAAVVGEGEGTVLLREALARGSSRESQREELGVTVALPVAFVTIPDARAEATVRVALGVDASSRVGHHYAVDGDADELVRALAAALPGAAALKPASGEP